LSEVAAVRGGLDRITRLLRPRAPLIAGELAPSIFWDVVRGVRPTWWARSANSEFPVGALLTNREWLDELETAGFVKVTGQPILGEESIGVVLHGIAGSQSTAADGSHIERVNVSWEGDETPNISALQALLRGGPGHSASDGGSSSKHPAIADAIWTVDARMVESASVSSLGGRLAQLADRCQRLATAPARLWVLVDFGILPETQNCLEQPIWCALTAALRVAQNEYAGLEIRCIGLSGAEDPSLCERVAEEIISLTDEREIYFHGAERIVFRIERGVSEPSSLPARSSEPVLKLSSRSASSRGSLVWVPDERRSPEPEEVEIEVMATGLNFRDVMWNLGLLPEEALENGYAGSSLGMECAGIVSAVGEGVRGPAIGDRVMAFVSAGFSTHVVAPAFAVRPIPVQLTFEAAASLPVAFLTAYYSLVHLGGLKRGETILIHGGAGAVGLAALQIAQYCGASVIATAGSEEKRALLRDLGVAAVFNSRTLAFADDVLVYTGGKGVDVVLNSLAGEAMVRSMDCLRPFGRFIELG